MFYINDKSFVYLLYPKKYDTEDNKAVFDSKVDMLYYYLNRGVPMNGLPKPIYCTQEMIDQYGLDNVVMNMQRHYKYDYDIVVVKVPQEFLRAEPTFGATLEKYDFETFKSKVIPMSCRYSFNGKMQDMIACEYIESVYLRYPDCRRVINDNWKLVSNENLGMVLTDDQKKNMSFSGKYEERSHFVDREKYMETMNLDTDTMCQMCQDDKSKKDKYGNSDSAIRYIKDKYMYAEKVYTCRMTKNRIESILAVEDKRKEKIERCRFVGE